MQQPRIGDIVCYVPGTTDGFADATQIRPAIVVRVWSVECVQLQVFTDGPNDQLINPDGSCCNVKWASSVTYSKEKIHRSWHWPTQE